MHSKINKIIEEWIGEDEEEVIGNRTGRGAKSVTKVIKNKLRQDLRNKSPQLTEEIVRVVEKELEQYVERYVPNMCMPIPGYPRETMLPKNLFVKGFIN